MNRIAFSPGRPHTKRRRPSSRRLELELLEARNLLSFTNVLVNNPAEDTTAHDTQSETAIVLGAHSNVVVAFNDDGVSSSPPQLGGYSLSTNGGTSFTDEGSIPPGPSPYNGASDLVLARSSATGTIFLSAFTRNLALNQVAARVNVFRSTDNGATFNTPASGTPGFVDGVERADKPWIAVDNYSGPGNGNVYLSWTDYLFNPDGTLTNNGIFFTRSTDDGQDWGPSGGVPIKGPKGNQTNGLPVQGSFVTVGPDHAVYVFWWDFSNGPTIRMRKSTDQGQTFGEEEIVTGLKTHRDDGNLGLTYSNTNSSIFNTNAFPQAAVNPVNGDIYVVYDDQANGSADKADIFFVQSTDGGVHWSKPLRVNDDLTNTDQWQPALALTPDGNHLGIFWYDRRNDPVNDSLIDRYGVIGTISGHTVSFAPNIRITDVSFPPVFNQDPFFKTPGYMGDYDMATADNNYFYTTWGDNRLSDAFFANQPDVRFAQIPVTEEDTPAATAAQTAATQSPAPTVSPDPTLLLPGTLAAALGTPAAKTAIRSVHPVHESSPLAVSGTASTSHVPATDAVFAAAGQAANDDAAWLFGSLSGRPMDGI